MKYGIRSGVVGIHIFMACLCLPSNYPGIGVNLAFAAFWPLLLLRELTRSPQEGATPHD